MDFNKPKDPISAFIRDRINQARIDAGETQGDLAQALGRSRVSISDIERGRVAISAPDLALIAAHYGLPVSFFFPSQLSVTKNELSRLDQELLATFWSLTEEQKYVAIEYLKQLARISKKAFERIFRESFPDTDEG